MESPEELADGAPSYPVAPTVDEPGFVPGLLVRRYHPACPAWGEIRHVASGLRVVYLRTRDALAPALDALSSADWSTDGDQAAIRDAFDAALQVEGVTHG